MGNQALVPSQIQSVENYLIDLKTYIQFRSSLGSTTFMKTAKVNLIDNSLEDANNYNIISSSSVTSSSNLNDPLLTNANSNLINSGASANSNSGPNQSQNSNLNTSTLNMNSSSVSSSANSGLNKANLVKQKLQQLRESQQVVVVKIFPKYDLSIRLDLYSKRIKEIKSIIQSRYGMNTNCLPCSEFIITDRAAFLFRQFIRYNLYDRISTRPFLTLVEKKWITFQLLCAVNEIHSLQIVHGDIKAENVLVNSFLWVSLTDFASYKPVYLSKNHPTADFNYYFDISRRRTCYLAPERLDSTRSDSFREKTQPVHAQNQNLAEHEAMYEVMPPDPNDFKPSMDIFGLGCVIAELFMERPLFDFAHLLAYRERKYDPSSELANEIGDKNILDMLAGMLSLNENERKSVNEYLQEQNDKAFPSYFVFLKNYISRFINVSLTADEIVIRLKNDLPILLKNFKLNLNENMSSSSSMSEDNSSSMPFKSASLNKDAKNENTNDAFLILLSLLLSSIRKIKFSENKLIAIELMKTFSKFLDDSIILERILPYYLILLEDQPNQTQSPIVKSHVIYALNDCLSNIYKIDVQNLNIFPEIIFECLEQLSKDDSFLVRSAVAKTISSFALTSLRYLDTVFLTKRSFLTNDSSNLNTSQSNSSQNISNELESEVEHTKMNRLNATQSDFSTYDKEYEAYQAKLTEIVMHLMTDTSSNAVKETLIHSDISKLCSFFSRQKTSEFLLPHMITMLNEKTDWSVRAAFFDALCPVLTCIGWESVEIVKSLLEQGLRDSEEFVIYRTLLTLGRMVQVGLLDRQQICYFLNNHIAPLLCHPSLWIRHGAVSYISTVCKQKNTKLINGLNTADVLCSVAPILAKFLERKDLINYDKEEILFSCLKKPIRRAVYDCISQDGSSDQLFIYLNQRSEIRCLTNFNYLPGYVDCADPSVQRFFEKLCKLGFIEEDEDKLLHLKEFMDKTRISRLSSSLHNADMSASNNSTTSVLNASSANLKENFSLKDGYINIMKEKFQRCNCEYLNVRKESLFSADDSSKRDKTASSKLDESPTTAIASSAPQTEANYNNEWKVMFGKSSEPQAEPKQASLTRQRSIVSSPGAHKQRLAHFNQQLSARKYDCTMEVERYLDRMTFFYDEHSLKRNKALKLKESINASISSNSICLSSSIGKWKPKGYLILHSNEHTKEINKLSRNSDSTYFSTCSTSESCVKIWSTDNLLDAKSGFFKSIFTYDRQNSQDGSMTRPCCTTFYNKNSLAILCEDFRFYVIDFNSNRTQYRLYSNEKLFKSNTCKSLATYNELGVHKQNSSFDKTSFFYLNKAYKSSASAHNKCGPRSCSCSSNYPVDMIRIDDSSPSWPIAATNSYDYFVGTRGSSVKSLFCYSTSSGDVSCIDMRTRTKAFELKRDLRKGYVTSMITDPCYTWIGMGTSSGDIEIYDFRFMLPVKRFEHHFKSAVVRLCNHPMSANRIVASYQGNNEIAVWNMENSSSNLSGSANNKAAYDPEFVFWGEQSVPPLCQKKLSSSYIKYVSGLIGCSAGEQNGTNGLICASTDMKMRYIDLNEQNKESYVISSAFNFQQNVKSSAEMNAQASSAGSNTSSKSEFANSLMSQSVSYETRQIEGTKVLLEQDQQFNSGQKYSINNSNLASTSFSYNSPALTHQSYFTHHQDAITDLVVCYNPLNNKNHPLIVTSARDGALKIWR